MKSFIRQEFLKILRLSPFKHKSKDSFHTQSDIHCFAFKKKKKMFCIFTRLSDIFTIMLRFSYHGNTKSKVNLHQAPLTILAILLRPCEGYQRKASCAP